MEPKRQTLTPIFVNSIPSFFEAVKPIEDFNELLKVVGEHKFRDQTQNEKAIFSEYCWWMLVLKCRYDMPTSATNFHLLESKSGWLVKYDKQLPQSRYADWITQHQLTPQDRLLLATAIVNTINPLFFRPLLPISRKIDITVLGGYIRKQPISFFPTLQTVLYLLGGTDAEQHLFYKNYFRQTNIKRYGIVLKNNPAIDKILTETEDQWMAPLNRLVSLDAKVWEYFLGGERPVID
ncbi:MAG: hypothetical protein AAF734_01180 [Bacteroidota bacterium]